MATKKLLTNSKSNKHSKTSIGRSTNTSPKHKDQKRSHKKYRGQGKPR